MRALVGEERRRKANEGKGTTRRARGGKEEKGKRSACWLPRVPARLPRRGTYAISRSLRPHELPPLLACGERERRPGMSITVSNIVLLYTLYGGTSYITVSRSETCRESELNLGTRIQHHRSFSKHVFVIEFK